MKPLAPIRRFDVFAEYSRRQALRRGMDDAHARGYGLWVAKVVASGGGRRAGKAPGEQRAAAGEGAPHEGARADAWHELGGEPQTDALFEREVVRRMGAEFYNEVFAPAIAEAFDRGQRYEAIRDSIRREWKP